MRPSFFIAAALLICLLLHLLLPSVVSSTFCGEKCNGRCGNAGSKKRCLKYCGICCEKCKCVPSGTYGNKDECPCYRDWVTTPKLTPKCP